MKSVTIHTGKVYEVLIGQGLLEKAGELMRPLTKAKIAMIVSDDNVFPLYGEVVKKSLEAAGFSVESHVFPHGENSKNLETYKELLIHMCDCRMSRNDVVVALGGGVVGDLTGFAAASYQRGCGFVQIPTSLLADVDSSVGGKTAVDLPNGKNQVGAFYQPLLVICDTESLRTLPEEEYENGCAEIIKYAVLEGRELFDKLRNKPVKEQFEEIIERCVISKNDYVKDDEFDTGKRMFLNLGHTMGHAVEACSRYEIPHGQAVAIGLSAIAKAAEKMGYAEAPMAQEIEDLLLQYHLPVEMPFKVAELDSAAQIDKKNTAEKMRLIVPLKIGHNEVVTISKSEFTDWLMAGGAK